MKRSEQPKEIDLKRAVTPILDVLWAEHGVGGSIGHPDGTFQMQGTNGVETVYLELKRWRRSRFRPMQVKQIKRLIANGASVYFAYMEKPIHLPMMEKIVRFDRQNRAITNGIIRRLSDDPVLGNSPKNKF